MVSVPVAESKDHVAVFPHFPDVLDAANTVAGSSVNVNMNVKNKLHILLLIFSLQNIIVYPIRILNLSYHVRIGNTITSYKEE